MLGRTGLLALHLTCWLCWPALVAAQDSSAVAEVTALVGAGTVTPFGGGDETALVVGTGLHEGDRIRTDAGARAKLEFVDGAVVQLGENTDFVLEWTLYVPETGTQNTLFRMTSGILRVIADLVLPRTTFEVRTETAVASVRGTDWITEAAPGNTAIVALDGEVAVRSSNPTITGEVVLGPGEGTGVAADAVPNPVTVWGDARRESFIERTSVP